MCMRACVRACVCVCCVPLVPFSSGRALVLLSSPFGGGGSVDFTCQNRVRSVYMRDAGHIAPVTVIQSTSS